MPQLLTEFVDAIVAFASGRQTCNEKNDFRELAIFKSGVTLRLSALVPSPRPSPTGRG